MEGEADLYNFLKKLEKIRKKVLTNKRGCDIICKSAAMSRFDRKKF